MIGEFLDLRNAIHSGKFRFNLTRGLWGCHYLAEKELEANTVIRVVENGILRGYAVYSIFIDDGVRALKILEICADRRATLVELIDYIGERGVKEGVDFILLQRCREPYDDVFDKMGFLTFVTNVIMIVLLNPKELLSSLSEEIERGKILKLIIKGFDPINIRVGKKAIMVVENKRYDLTVQTDSKTFVKLFFGKTSFLKELLKRKIVTDNLFHLPTLSHFFSAIKQKEWYIPPGDWC